jgi:hypothetical protein
MPLGFRECSAFSAQTLPILPQRLDVRHRFLVLARDAAARKFHHMKHKTTSERGAFRAANSLNG